MSGDAPGFDGRIVAALIAAALVLGASFVVLGVFAPDWRDGHDGGAHALSNAGVGFSGIVALARDTGLPVRVSREAGNAHAGLLVLTPSTATDPADVVRLIRAQDDAPVLIVLPKWQVVPLPDRIDWVQRLAPLGDAAAGPLATLVPAHGPAGHAPDFVVASQRPAAGARLTAVSEVRLTTAAPRPEATIAGPALQPVLVDPAGRVVLGWLAVRNSYVLADPDLLNNAALKDPAAARAALALLAQLGGAHGVVFDVTLDGFARSYDLARLALVPPFLGVTLCLLAAAALAGIAAAVRFGAPQPAGRPIAFGTRALVDNAAELIRVAHREPAAVVRYAQATGEAASAAVGAPPGLDPDALTAWLAARGPPGDRFAALAAAAAAATDRPSVVAAARALFFWHREIVDDR